MSACGICGRDNVETLEALGEEALNGARSWRSAAAEGGLSYHSALKNHMERHWVKPGSGEVSAAFEAQEGDFASLLFLSVEELQAAAERAPAEVKPFYLIAIQNLKGLSETKPSQQHLINALKAIHEVTGMKMEQRIMLEFAQHAFGAKPAEAIAAIEEHTGIIDAEIVEDEEAA